PHADGNYLRVLLHLIDYGGELSSAVPQGRAEFLESCDDDLVAVKGASIDERVSFPLLTSNGRAADEPLDPLGRAVVAHGLVERLPVGGFNEGEGALSGGEYSVDCLHQFEAEVLHDLRAPVARGVEPGS